MFYINGKIKCRESINLNVSSPTFFNYIIIEVIVKWVKRWYTIKKMIRLRIKPNFAVLGRKYWFDYKNAKIRYSEEKSS